MTWNHKLGGVIRKLRQLRLAGVRVPALVSAVKGAGVRDPMQIYEYLETAFCGKQLASFGLMAERDPENPAGWDRMERIIDESRYRWEAQRFPELMRIQDYIAFLQFSKDEHLIVSVCGATPEAGRWIGRVDTRCYNGRVFVLPRDSGPHAGLLAADPTDERLQAWLKSYGPPFPYFEYVARLESEGLQVLGPDNGYVIEDTHGRRFHEAYRLHGVYDSRTYEPVWHGARGERLRAALNRLLGAELVQGGPHDNWEFRNSREVAGLLWGPQVPTIEFKDGETIRNLLSRRQMAQSFQYRNIWSDLYPNHPMEEDAQP